MTISLLRTIGSPFTPRHREGGIRYSKQLYSIADVNKTPLIYLNTIAPEERRKLPEYRYHHTRLQRLLEMAAEVSELFEKEGISYVVFKTLRPYPEDVADIDVLNLGSPTDYEGMIKILRQNGYVLMEAGACCTTFADYRTHFKTEAMIDVYNEISVSHLIYLDKHKLNNYVEEAKLPDGGETKIFTPEADLLAIIAHSAIKENAYILAEYYTTLHYLAKMNQDSIQRFVSLVRENRLVNAARWHLTITSLLHKIAHGVVPEKLADVLSILGGPRSRAYESINAARPPPYPCDPLTLMSFFKEKLQDRGFRRSLCNQTLHTPTTVFTRRLLSRLTMLLAR